FSPPSMRRRFDARLGPAATRPEQMRVRGFGNHPGSRAMILAFLVPPALRAAAQREAPLEFRGEGRGQTPQPTYSNALFVGGASVVLGQSWKESRFIPLVMHTYFYCTNRTPSVTGTPKFATARR